MVDGNDMLAVYDVAKRHGRSRARRRRRGAHRHRHDAHAGARAARRRALRAEGRCSTSGQSRDPIARFRRQLARARRRDRQELDDIDTMAQELRGRGGRPGGTSRRCPIRRAVARGVYAGDDFADAAARVREVAVRLRRSSRTADDGESSPTWKPSAQALSTRWRATSACSCSARTSASTAARSRSTEGLHRSVRRSAGHRHANLRTAIVGSAIGASYMGMRPVCRDPVHRLHRLLLRHADELRRDQPLPQRRRRADRRPRAVRRRRRRRAVSFAQPRIVLPQHARAEDGRALDRVRREGAAQGRDSRRRPGAVLRAQVSVSHAIKDEVPDDDYIVPIGKATIAREAIR